MTKLFPVSWRVLPKTERQETGKLRQVYEFKGLSPMSDSSFLVSCPLEERVRKLKF
jgi:hypothetical protein